MSHKHGEARVFKNGEYSHTIKKDGSNYQEKSIIEKLGITTGLWEAELLNDESDSTRVNGAEFCSDNSWLNGEFTEKLQREIHKTATLIAAAPEMLDAMISYCVYIEKTGEYEAEEKWISIIQKATGKSWDEIKELL